MAVTSKAWVIQVEETSQLSIGKVGTIIGVGVTLALLLLALLFSSHSSDQFESFVPLNRQCASALSASEPTRV